MPSLAAGSQAPSFSLPNQHGAMIELQAFAGRNVLLWFFPRAFGGG
ncbi:MAG: redoxin family protein [Gammaproteobacteria bacterium]|nr:redoxin family protein [Gammaproteobacteria bacterium]